MNYKIIFVKIKNYLTRCFSRFFKSQFWIFCILSLFVYPLFKSDIILWFELYFYKYIEEIPGHEIILYTFVSIISLIIFGLITTISNDIFLLIKKYFKAKKIKNLELKVNKPQHFLFFIFNLESLAKENNLYKVPENLWEVLRVAINNLNFKYIIYYRISFRHLLKIYRKIYFILYINAKIFKLLQNKNNNGILKKRNKRKKSIKILKKILILFF